MRRFIYYNEYGDSIEFSDKTNFKVIHVDGLNSNEVEMMEASADVQVGTQVTSQKVKSKPITIEGDFKENYKNRRKLIDTIAPAVNATLRMIDDVNKVDVYIKGMPKITPFISETKVYQRFQFVFYCPFPYWRSTTKEAFDFFLYQSRFRFPRSYSSTMPWKISTRIMKTIVNVYNSGTIRTGFTIKIKALATVKAPEIIDIVSQKKIKMKDSFTLEDGDILTIYNYQDNLQILKESKGVTENAFGDLDIDETSFFQLNVGDNVIRAGALQNEESMDLTIEFDRTLAGV